MLYLQPTTPVPVAEAVPHSAVHQPDILEQGQRVVHQPAAEEALEVHWLVEPNVAVVLASENSAESLASLLENVFLLQATP